MSRATGIKNANYEERKRALALSILPRLLADGGRTSLNEMAAAADASVPTLKHYFGGRSGVIAEALREQKRVAQQYLSRLSTPGDESMGPSLERFALELIEAWVSFGVGRLFVIGLVSGAYDEQIGPGYLDGILEPTVQAMEQRMMAYAARNEITLTTEEEARIAALEFLSPLLIALIHQDALLGSRCRPLNLKSFAAAHTQHFLKAYRPQEP